MQVFICRLAAIGLSLSVLSRPSSALDVTTNIANRHQSIVGWGTALWEDTSRDPRFRAAYRDAGMNIVRLNMAKEVLVASPTDYATPVPLGSNLDANIELMNFRANDDMIAKAEFAQWLKANAPEPERVKVSASPWTAPHWMKGPTGATQNFVGVTDNHPTPFLSNMVVPWQQHNPIPTGDSVGGRLRTEDPQILRQYGEYLAAWVRGFEREYGVPIDVMSLQNESTFENPFDSMVLNIDQNRNTDYDQYALALASVHDAWQRHGVDTKVMGPHVAQVGPTPQNPWGLLAQNRYIEAVKNAGNPALIDFLDYYNSNYYMPADEAGVQATAGYYHGKNAVSAPWVFWTYAPGVKQDSKPIWYSETGGEESNWINGSGGTAGDGAITVALKMFNALVHSNATAYLYWQFSDGGSSVTEHTLLNGSSLNNPLASNKYVAFNHFSRFVRPGAIRVDSTFSNGRASINGASEYDTLRSINVSTFLHEEDETLTYVLLNLRNSSESITIDLPDEISFERFQFYRSSETEKLAQLADIVVQNGQVTFSMPRYSLVTLVGDILVPPVIGDYNRDGAVDAADYVEWKTAFGSANLLADGNENGMVDAADYVVWRKAAGQSMARFNVTNVALPEPSGVLITCLAFAVAALNRLKLFH